MCRCGKNKRCQAVSICTEQSVNALLQQTSWPTISHQDGDGTRPYSRDCNASVSWHTGGCPLIAAVSKNNSLRPNKFSPQTFRAFPAPCTIFSYPTPDLVNKGLASPYLEPVQHRALVSAHSPTCSLVTACLQKA
jgi:hypothetical protein